MEPAASVLKKQAKMSLKIGHIPASLIAHLAEFDDETQDFVLTSIVALFQTSTANKVIAHGVGFVPTIVDILVGIKSKKLNIRDELTLQLIRLLSLLCSFSITPDNLRAILNLMSQWPKFAPYILSALSEMPQTPSISQHSFALYEYGSGITCSESIPSSSRGWTFFAWVCVDTIPPGHCRRRLLLSLIDDDDWCGYEVFISQQNELILATLTQSHFSWTSEPIHALTDGQWHSLAVSWTNPKGGSVCQLYLDGRLVSEVACDLPNTGKLRVRLGHGLDVPRVAPSKELPSSKSLSNLAGAAFVAVTGLARKVKKSTSANQLSEKMNQITNFEQDQTFGRPGPLCGLLGYCTLVEGGCQASHFEYLHKLGPNSLSQYQATCEVTVGLQTALRLYYHPKNVSGHKIYNLAPGDRGDASLVGQTHGATDLRGAIHALSGVTVLYPLLEEMKTWKMCMEPRQSQRREDTIINAEEYPVASFLQLIRRVLSGPEVALRALSVESNAFAVLGALLQRLPGRLIDGEVLYQIQLLSESFEDLDLVSSIRHFLLFDFRVWVDSAYITRVSHIQYLSTLIKDSRRTSRSKYGVQFMLDVIRTFCSTNQDLSLTPRGSFSSEKSSLMLEDEESQVREAIFQLIQFYMLRNATVEEIDAVLSFIISCGSSANRSEQKAAVEALIKLNGLLKKVGSDNLVRILFEAERGELLWVSMVKLASYSPFQKETLAFFLSLLKSPHVSDAYRGRIRLQHGSHSVMGGLFIKLRPCEPLVHKKLIELMFKCDFALEDKFNLGQLLVSHSARVEERLQHNTALMEWLHKAPEAARLASQISGWQDTLVKSLVVDFDAEEGPVTEELGIKCRELIYHLSWKGTLHIKNHKTRWTERLGVWTLLVELLPPEQSIVQCQKLLDMWLQAAAGPDRIQDSYTNSRDGEVLTHLFYHYFMVGDRVSKLEDNTLESLMKLLDILMVWQTASGDDGWPELQKLALAILLKSLTSTCGSILAFSTAKLHEIVSYRKSLPVIEEACFILVHFDKCLKNHEENPTACSFIFTVLREILEQLPYGSTRLGKMPRTKGNAKFQAEFTEYHQTEEWNAFIQQVAAPSARKYENQILDENSTVDIEDMLSKAKESAKVAGHARDKKNGEAKLQFEQLLESPFSSFLSSELARYNKAKRQLTNQQSGSLRAWRRMKRFLLGPRGPWSGTVLTETDSIMSTDQDQINHWKLSNVENFSRMRLKLTQNYNFDIYREASELRDNRAPTKEISFEPPEIEVKPKLEDENEGDEDWNALVPDPTRNQKKEIQKVTQMCHLITLTEKFEGRLEVSDKFLYFFDESPKKDEDESNADFKWSVSSLKKIFPRRYNLRRTAIEIFMFDQTNYLINFESRSARDLILKSLQEVCGPTVQAYTKNAEKRFAASGITQKWLNHEITNFEYLMQLNTFAGRTYNDLSQYPVFPWVIGKKLLFIKPVYVYYFS